MSGTCSSTWPSFLDDLPSSQTYGSIYDEDLFHRQFKTLCAATRERDPERLLARFLRHHDQIMAFVSALDEATGLDEINCLSSIFFSKALEVVDKALRTKQKDKFVQDYLPQLSDVIPAFGAELPLFPESEIVQKPLQQIFREYMQCYESLLQLLDPQQDTVTFETFSEQASSSTRAIANMKKSWEELIKQAALDQAAAAARDEITYADTAQSYYNTSLGGSHTPQTTRVSFEWIELLGKGTFGEVHKVRESSTGTFYARKTIRPPDASLTKRVQADFLNEVAIMQRLRHHHIASVQFHVIEGDTYSLFMLPAAEYDLRAFLRQCAHSDFPSRELMHLTAWFGCLIGALAFAHSHEIKHEDIKPGNILIKDYQPYLTDFGCAKDFSALDGSTSIESLVTGTPVYFPPESQPRGRKGDVFSLGCVFSEMLTVKYKRALHDFQAKRYVQHQDNGYAFRENLEAVTAWLDGIVPETDAVGTLLKEQTFLMLEPNVGRRKEAREIRRGLRVEGDMVFCNSCY